MKLLEKIRAAKAGKSFGARLAITLVELTLVLALAAIVVFVAVRAYSNAQENSRVQQAASTVGQIRSVVESLAQGQALNGVSSLDISPGLMPMAAMELV